MPRRKKQSSEAAVRDVLRREKIRIVLDGLRSEIRVAELCRRARQVDATFFCDTYLHSSKAMFDSYDRIYTELLDSSQTRAPLNGS